MVASKQKTHLDNSTSHGAYADDALNASNVNLNPGGKSASKLRDTIKQVLLERNLWRAELKLECKNGAQMRRNGTSEIAVLGG